MENKYLCGVLKLTPRVARVAHFENELARVYEALCQHSPHGVVLLDAAGWLDEIAPLLLGNAGHSLALKVGRMATQGPRGGTSLSLSAYLAPIVYLVNTPVAQLFVEG